MSGGQPELRRGARCPGAADIATKIKCANIKREKTGDIEGVRFSSKVAMPKPAQQKLSGWSRQELGGGRDQECGTGDKNQAEQSAVSVESR